MKYFLCIFIFILGVSACNNTAKDSAIESLNRVVENSVESACFEKNKFDCCYTPGRHSYTCIKVSCDGAELESCDRFVLDFKQQMTVAYLDPAAELGQIPYPPGKNIMGEWLDWYVGDVVHTY